MRDCLDFIIMCLNHDYDLLDEMLTDCFDNLDNLYHTDSLHDDNNLIDSHHFNLVIFD